MFIANLIKYRAKMHLLLDHQVFHLGSSNPEQNQLLKIKSTDFLQKIN